MDTQQSSETKQTIEEKYQFILPMTGRVLVELEKVVAEKKVGSVWIVDTTAKNHKYRKGVVVSVSKDGVLCVGGKLSPHLLKSGDAVLVLRTAGRDVSGGAGLKPGTLCSIWENYVLAIVQNDEGGEKIMELKPMYDRVVLKRIEGSDKTPGGIFIPSTAQEKSDKGEVIAVGEGRLMQDGTVRKMAVEIGDQVLFSKFAGTEVKINVPKKVQVGKDSNDAPIYEDRVGEEERVIVKEDDILAVMPKAKVS
jgi:chaperonin GroES